MQHLDSPEPPTTRTAEPLPRRDTSSSLLSLPDELLALVVDQALGEFAPRLYKTRLDGVRALSLVNKRVRAVAQDELLKAVHISIGRDEDAAAVGDELVVRGTVARARALSMGRLRVTEGIMRAPQFLSSFRGLRRLWLVRVHGVRVEDINQLQELRELVFAQVDLVVSRPLALSRLTSLDLFFNTLTGRQSLVGNGLPVLQHLFIGQAVHDAHKFGDRDLFSRTSTLAFELQSTDGAPGAWSNLGLDKATLDKALFDFLPAEVDLLGARRVEVDVQYVRVYQFSMNNCYSPGELASQLDDLADRLHDIFPALVSLYIAADLDPQHVMLPRAVADAMSALATACRLKGAELVYEGSFDEYVVGESRRSAHFEARCKRVEAERAAAAAAATTSTARA
ncbi:hypothetical protein JCM3775_001711 [Rhodotorula graminis]|uniref:Uncharacterized protein n=1 Tax=Rhodotorula graminis (strain WP1) TaxID=578459 RepID=A0A194S3M3_RHOGW|nr:uncharacterized protein RHOBADRAFT_43838 [Rhodotorula graminis WP1]KPV75333.1 hypothetical protein RHOBADRAFT_43838 [Rhodotorula graminis WP1]